MNSPGKATVTSRLSGETSRPSDLEKRQTRATRALARHRDEREAIAAGAHREPRDVGQAGRGKIRHRFPRRTAPRIPLIQLSPTGHQHDAAGGPREEVRAIHRSEERRV